MPPRSPLVALGLSTLLAACDGGPKPEFDATAIDQAIADAKSDRYTDHLDLNTVEDGEWTAGRYREKPNNPKYPGFRFQGRAGDDIEVRVRPRGSTDPVLLLYRFGNDTRLAKADDNWTGEGETIRYTLPSSDRYVAIVAEFDHEPGSFELRVDGGGGSTGGDEIRLNNGLLEVQHSGVWRGVCDDSFDERDAEVACRQLGGDLVRFETGQSGPSARFWMDDLDCSGFESKLSSCSFAGWGEEDCGDREWVRLACGGSTGDFSIEPLEPVDVNGGEMVELLVEANHPTDDNLDLTVELPSTPPFDYDFEEGFQDNTALFTLRTRPSVGGNFSILFSATDERGDTVEQSVPLRIRRCSCNFNGCSWDGGGCNINGCWEEGGGCNINGCWEEGGGCNFNGCWEPGELECSFNNNAHCDDGIASLECNPNG